MRVFGQPLRENQIRSGPGRVCLNAHVRACEAGFKAGGSVRGRPGRIEVFRGKAPNRFLLNNWQSWGPMQAMERGERFKGLAERMAEYSRYVFSPIPDVFAAALVSDYFFAWEGTIVGFLSSRVAHPYFAVEGDEVVGYLEYFGAELTQDTPLEPLVVLQGRPVEELLEAYAGLAAAENGVRVPDHNPVGWSSWYQYFTAFGLEDLVKNLRLARQGYPFEVFQIDDGYEADIGDWLRVKAGFPPLPDLAARIREQGFTAGLWTAPFSASESSEVLDKHPDWFVAEGGRPKPCYRNWKKTIYALDATHPGAREWLFETFSSLHRMGFAYHKIDFLFAGAMEGERFAAVTPIRAYREGLDVIRRAVGSDFVLGCGAPLLPSLGRVEGMRVGEDTAPFWNPALSGIQGPNAYTALRNPILRSFMHRRFWLNDPDCLLLRDRDIQLTFREKELYARVCGALDAMLIESDDLELVDARGRALLAEAIALKGGRVRVHGLLGNDLYVIASSGGPAGSFRLAANLSDRPRVVEGRTVEPRSSLFLDEPRNALP